MLGSAERVQFSAALLVNLHRIMSDKQPDVLPTKQWSNFSRERKKPRQSFYADTKLLRSS